jgi:hypothetical protein
LFSAEDAGRKEAALKKSRKRTDPKKDFLKKAAARISQTNIYAADKTFIDWD